MKDFWEQRYSEEEFVYGTEPNAFLVAQKNLLKPKMKTLVVGDGEGRNGVWLASQGLDVLSVDYAAAGLKKIQAMGQRMYKGKEIDRPTGKGRPLEIGEIEQ